ncbi:MAG: hypothetical protein KGS61_19430 [Verrucomicrobia bacterium]|nr:hypothetical protein [Verrucomicrobiota bacterium]
MRSEARLARWLLGTLMILVSTLVLTGCATNESENASDRPWNSPQDWEYNLPGGMIPPR